MVPDLLLKAAWLFWHWDASGVLFATAVLFPYTSNLWEKAGGPPELACSATGLK